MIIKLFNKLSILPLRSVDLFNALFMAKGSSKKSGHMVEGIIIKCDSAYYIAYYLHREDMMANGKTEKECLKNLKEMYRIIREAEDSGELTEYVDDGRPFQIPAGWDYKKFTAKLPRI